MWTYAVLSVLVYASALSKEDVKASIELTGLEYEDFCNTTANTEWLFINHPNNSTFQAWVNAIALLIVDHIIIHCALIKPHTKHLQWWPFERNLHAMK